MDLTLSLGYQQQNDNKAVILTDTSNWGAEGAQVTGGSDNVIDTMYEIVTPDTGTSFVTIGASANTAGIRFVSTSTMTLTDGVLKEITPKVSEITAATLDTVFTGVSNIPASKTQIDLYSEFGGPWAGQAELVYTITTILWDGTSSAELIEDGLYALTYDLTYELDGTPVSDTLEVTILVYGQVKVAVYDKFRQIPAWCNCKDDDALHQILETELCGAYLTGIEHSAYIAKTEELINMLIVLDDMVKNGSKLYY